jgi:hypothetical protein
LYQDGSIYYGQQKDFTKEGKGKLVSINGDIYEGEWENDKKNGRGMIKYADTGNVYIGDL